MDSSRRKSHFQTVHAEGRDFWNDPASRYEHDKRQAILKALNSPRYASVVEVGCSTGLLSRDLALRSDRFLGLDLSETAIAATRARLTDLSHARARVVPVPASWPVRDMDLIVLSEMLYYLDAPEIAHLAGRCATGLTQGGEIAVVCYLGQTETALDGQEAAMCFVSACRALRPFTVTTHPAAGPYLHLGLIAAKRPA